MRLIERDLRELVNRIEYDETLHILLQQCWCQEKPRSHLLFLGIQQSIQARSALGSTAAALQLLGLEC